MNVNSSGSLLICTGHAIWQSGRWLGGFPGEDRFYAAHVEASIRLGKDYDVLAFSGGRTRPTLEAETGGVSEAEGMRDYAIEAGVLDLTDDSVILEKWARDSMENLFFSMLAYFRKTGRWPVRVGVVSWNSKGLRFHLIASGLRLGGRIFFHGVGDYPAQTDLERACAAEARFNAQVVDLSRVPPDYRLIDPLLRNETEFACKRWARMPREFTPDASGNRDYIAQVKRAYHAPQTDVGRLIDRVEHTAPGDGWKEIEWPWQ